MVLHFLKSDQKQMLWQDKTTLFRFMRWLFQEMVKRYCYFLRPQIEMWNEIPERPKPFHQSLKNPMINSEIRKTYFTFTRSARANFFFVWLARILSSFSLQSSSAVNSTSSMINFGWKMVEGLYQWLTVAPCFLQSVSISILWVWYSWTSSSLKEYTLSGFLTLFLRARTMPVRNPLL